MVSATPAVPNIARYSSPVVPRASSVTAVPVTMASDRSSTMNSASNTAVRTPAAIAAANAPGTPAAAATATAPNAPAMIVPSRPILIVPDRSTSVSPNAASASGVAVRTVASRNGAIGSITVLQRPLAARRRASGASRKLDANASRERATPRRPAAGG